MNPATEGKGITVNPIRGIVMVIAACIAFYRGWQIHAGHSAWLAYGLGTVALILAVWHFIGNRSRPRL
jgi:hypothetical protein